MSEENINEENNVEVIEDAATQEKQLVDLPIFPLIKCEREKNTLILLTYFRKKHQGKYYLVKFDRRAYVPEGRMVFSPAISSFMRDIYLMMLHGKISVRTKRNDGTRYYKLDENQMDEKLRMKPIL